MSANNLITVLLVLVSLLYLLVLGAILRRQDSRKGIVAMLLGYVGLSLLWTVAIGLDFFAVFPTGILFNGTLYGVLFLAVIFFQLTRSFVQQGGPAWLWWILGVVLATGVIVVNEAFIPLPAMGVPAADLGLWLGIAIWGLIMAACVTLTARSYLQTDQPLHRNRLRYWMLALLFTVGAGLLFFLENSALSSSFHLVGVLIVTYAVLTHNLFDIRRMVRRSISYLIMTLLTVVIYTAGFWVVQYLFQSLPNYNPIWAGATVALLLSIFFNPLLRVVQNFVRGLITGGGYDASRIVGEYSSNINNILDLKRLGTVTLTFISQTIGTERGILFVVNTEANVANVANVVIETTEMDETDEASEAASNGSELQREDEPNKTASNGSEPQPEDEPDKADSFLLRGIMGTGKGLAAESDLPNGELSIEGPVGNYLSQENRSLTQYDIDLLPSFATTSAPERSWLTTLNMAVYVPIQVKDRWIGLFTFGPKRSGDRYFEADLALLRTLADQTAIAFENARLFDDLKAYTEKIEDLNGQLAQANRNLASLDQAKSDFIGVASHELRTPLTQVRGFNDILGDMASTGDLTPESAVQMTNGIRKSASRLQAIVDTMFDVSQIDTKTLDLNASPNSIASIIKFLKEELTQALAERKITMSIEDLTALPMITADGQRIKQIFSNLIQNAVKYTPDGGQIRVTGALLHPEQEADEQLIEIVIHDTGIGISAEDLERLFDKFYRVGDVSLHSTGATKFKGAGPGLGLTVARGLVEAHGGRIWAESPGHDEEHCPGSAFHVVLPLEPARLHVGDEVVTA